jgi:hypothetical protein
VQSAENCLCEQRRTARRPGCRSPAPWQRTDVQTRLMAAADVQTRLMAARRRTDTSTANVETHAKGSEHTLRQSSTCPRKASSCSSLTLTWRMLIGHCHFRVRFAISRKESRSKATRPDVPTNLQTNRQTDGPQGLGGVRRLHHRNPATRSLATRSSQKTLSRGARHGLASAGPMHRVWKPQGPATTQLPGS